MAGLERRSDLAEGRFVSLAQRAQRLAAFLPLRRQRRRSSADHARRVGDSAHPRRRSCRHAGSISRRRRTAPIGLDLYRVRRGRQRICSAVDNRRTPSGVRQSVAHAVSRFVERHHDAAAGPRPQHDTRDRRCASSTRIDVPALNEHGTVEARAAAGEDPRRVRHGSDDDQAAELRSRAALSRLPVHVRGAALASRSSTRGAARTFCTTSCSPSAASSCGSATTAPPAARACSRRGLSTRTSASSSCSDIEDGVAWLKRQPYVDGSRIGISGVSFGAYMTLYALTHSRSFAMGIAEGAVSDWRNYDTIYTERYMGLPERQPRRIPAQLAAVQRGRPQRASCCWSTARSTTTCIRRTRCSSPTSCSRRASRSR